MLVLSSYEANMCIGVLEGAKQKIRIKNANLCVSSENKGNIENSFPFIYQMALI